MPQLKKLHRLKKRAERIRRNQGFSKMGEVLYRAHESQWSDNEIIVEADGLGGATLLLIEGNYPLDYLIHSEKCFASESEACDAADDLVR